MGGGPIRSARAIAGDLSPALWVGVIPLPSAPNSWNRTHVSSDRPARSEQPTGSTAAERDAQQGRGAARCSGRQTAGEYSQPGWIWQPCRPCSRHKRWRGAVHADSRGGEWLQSLRSTWTTLQQNGSLHPGLWWVVVDQAATRAPLVMTALVSAFTLNFLRRSQSEVDQCQSRCRRRHVRRGGCTVRWSLCKSGAGCQFCQLNAVERTSSATYLITAVNGAASGTLTLGTPRSAAGEAAAREGATAWLMGLWGPALTRGTAVSDRTPEQS